MSTRFNASVGRKRLSKTTGSFVASSTRNARADMRNVIKNYRKLVDHIEEVTPSVLLDALKPVYDRSQVYVPRKYGNLARSGYLEITQFRGRPTVEIGYGKGGQPDYAAVVHEELEWRHKKPTRSKYLQAALVELESEVQQRIVAGLRRIF